MQPSFNMQNNLKTTNVPLTEPSNRLNSQATNQSVSVQFTCHSISSFYLAFRFLILFSFCVKNHFVLPVLPVSVHFDFFSFVVRCFLYCVVWHKVLVCSACLSSVVAWYFGACIAYLCSLSAIFVFGGWLNRLLNVCLNENFCLTN